VAGGALLLAGIVAAPVGILAVGGLSWMTRRNRKQEAELKARLDEAEAEIAASQRGFDASADVLTRAIILLKDVAGYGRFAVVPWGRQLPPFPIPWCDMTHAQQRHYTNFIEVAGCQMSVVSINVGELMTSRDEQLDTLAELADGYLLTLSRRLSPFWRTSGREFKG